MLNTIFVVGCALDNEIVGVATVGRLPNIASDDGWTLEVNRCATDGTKNCTSMLYAACWRIARELGYHRLITYTHTTESGASLRGAGWKIVHTTDGKTGWHNHPRASKHVLPIQPKYRWEITIKSEDFDFTQPRPKVEEVVESDNQTELLFDTGD